MSRRRVSETQLEGIVQEMVVDLVDHFSELDDREDAPFGEYARTVYEADEHYLVVMHATEPWGVRITIDAVDESDGDR